MFPWLKTRGCEVTLHLTTYMFQVAEIIGTWDAGQHTHILLNLSHPVSEAFNFFFEKTLHLKLSTVFSKKPCIWSFQLFFSKKTLHLKLSTAFSTKTLHLKLSIFFSKKTLHLKLSTAFSKKTLHLKLSTVFFEKKNLASEAFNCFFDKNLASEAFNCFFEKTLHLKLSTVFSKKNIASEAFNWFFDKNLASEAFNCFFEKTLHLKLSTVFSKKTLHLKLSIFFRKKTASDAWKARDGWKPRIHLWSGLSQQVHGATVCFLDGLSQQVFNCGQQVHLQVTCQNLRPQDFISTISLLAASSLASYVTKPFQWFAAPEGRKVGSLKRRLRSQLASWEMTNCTPLWREAHFQAKMYKTPGSRSTFGSWDVEKVHAVVARSTFPGFQLNKSIVKRFVLLMVCLNKVIVKQLFSPTLTFQESNDLNTAKSQTLGPRIYCAMAGNLGFTSWLMCLFSQCCWMKTMDLRSA